MPGGGETKRNESGAGGRLRTNSIQFHFKKNETKRNETKRRRTTFNSIQFAQAASVFRLVFRLKTGRENRLRTNTIQNSRSHSSIPEMKGIVAQSTAHPTASASVRFCTCTHLILLRPHSFLCRVDNCVPPFPQQAHGSQHRSAADSPNFGAP